MKSYNYFYTQRCSTDTKKLLVPSDLVNNPGNNLIQVSSPYIINRFPVKLACESQVSWYASVEDVSDSAILRIASRKLGMEPVVKALIRGKVTVGGSACAVNGHACPFDTWLSHQPHVPWRHTSEPNSLTNQKKTWNHYHQRTAIQAKYLLNASMTINTNRSNSFSAGSIRCNPRAS